MITTDSSTNKMIFPIKHFFLINIISAVLFITTSSNGQENNYCIIKRTNERGICKIITDCKSVQDDMIIRRRQPTICGYEHLLPIVCCPSPKITKTTIKPITSFKPLSKSETSI